MHRFSRMHLSPDEAMRKLDATDLGETSSIAEAIALIAVLDHRQDYLAAGYSCMRNYCMGRRRWSEDKALRWLHRQEDSKQAAVLLARRKSPGVAVAVAVAGSASKPKSKSKLPAGAGASKRRKVI